MKLKEVKHIGYGYFHVFRMDNGEELEVVVTEKEYRDLEKKDPIQPAINGGVWVLSYERPIFDTLDGLLRNNEFSSIEGRYKVIKVNGSNQFSVNNEDVQNDNVPQEIVEKAIKEKNDFNRIRER